MWILIAGLGGALLLIMVIAQRNESTTMALGALGLLVVAGVAVWTIGNVHPEDVLSPGEGTKPGRRTVDPFRAEATPPPPVSEEEQRQLERLHKDTVHWFVSQPGQGFSRMVRIPELPLDVVDYENPTIAPSIFLSSKDKLKFEHEQRQVMGFLVRGDGDPHENKWLDVQLVSLLNHEEPRVYDEEMMRMGAKGKKATRALDDFEQVALRKLLEGEELRITLEEKKVRMLGAIRARAKCLKCHEAEEGDLLGAFSYRLNSKTPFEASAVLPEPVGPPAVPANGSQARPNK